MKIITHKDIAELRIPPEKCFEWATQMIADKRNAVLPPKISMKPHEGEFCNVMPCIISSGDEMFGGVKIVNRYPERTPSLDSKLILQDMNSGEFLALMDANWITAMRTGAVAAHSILLFANKDFDTMGIVGLGNISTAVLKTLLAVRPCRNLNIKLLEYKDQAQKFIDMFKDREGVKFNVCKTADEVVRGSGVVVSAATYLSENLCGDDAFDEGVLVVPVHTRGFTNCDLFFDKVYADDQGHVCHFGYFDKFRYFAEVEAVVNGRAKGRENARERILVYNIGISVHDIFFAKKIYDMLKDKVPDISIDAPKEKIYI